MGWGGAHRHTLLPVAPWGAVALPIDVFPFVGFFTFGPIVQIVKCVRVGHICHCVPPAKVVVWMGQVGAPIQPLLQGAHSGTCDPHAHPWPSVLLAQKW